MFPINQFEIKKVKESEKAGTYTVGPLPKGYGHTLGNVFRRILLSSIQGAAVTKVKLGGIQHEYSTLAGVEGDILRLMLSIKGLQVVSHSDDPVVISLSVKGKKGVSVQVTAGDIDKNPLVDIINPEHVITTLTDDKAELEAEITIEKGFGYLLPNENARKEIGTIPIDAMFNPVTKVTLHVTNTRVGQQTDLDLIELEVHTNGAITPSAALHTATEILTKVGDHLLESVQSMLTQKDSDQVEAGELPMSEQVEEEEIVEEPIKVLDLNLSTRLTNALVNSEYEDLNQLAGLTEEEVSNIKGMGEKSFIELKSILEDHSITLI